MTQQRTYRVGIEAKNAPTGRQAATILADFKAAAAPEVEKLGASFDPGQQWGVMLLSVSCPSRESKEAVRELLKKYPAVQEQLPPKPTYFP